MNLLFFYLILYIILLVVSEKRYIVFLPTIPIYPNNEKEALLVKNATINRSKKDEQFFYLTDLTVSTAFENIVNESKDSLNKIIGNEKIISIILFFKYSINRARPNQVLPKIDVLQSVTANTPAYPAGHAFQAYYLAKILKKKYPEKQNLLDIVAEKCNDCRIKAGLHYPSDGLFAKQLVENLY